MKQNDKPRNFGERLKFLREQFKVTQGELAKSVNVSQQGIASWEINRTEPSLETLRKLSEFFNVSVDYLVMDNPKFNESIAEASNPEIRLLQRNAKKMSAKQRARMLDILRLTFDDFNWEDNE